MYFIYLSYFEASDTCLYVVACRGRQSKTIEKVKVEQSTVNNINDKPIW